MKGLTRIFRGPRATNTPRQTPLRQNAGYFATSSSFSVLFAEVVCDLGTTPPQTASAPPPVGGNCTTRGSVITHREGSHGRQTGGIALHGGPTRRRHAARRLRVVQNPHRSQPQVRRVASKTGAGPLGAKKFAQHHPSTPPALPRKNSPSTRKNAEFGVS